MIERGAISTFTLGKKPPVFKGKETMILELRTGVKSGVSSDFFVPVDSKSDQGKMYDVLLYDYKLFGYLPNVIYHFIYARRDQRLGGNYSRPRRRCEAPLRFCPL